MAEHWKLPSVIELLLDANAGKINSESLRNASRKCRDTHNVRFPSILESDSRFREDNSPFVHSNTVQQKSCATFKDTHLKTFLVLSSRLGKVYVYRFNQAHSLWLFGPQNPIRKLVIYLITNQLFELFVMITILANCILLTLDESPEEVEYMFTAIYTSEMFLKIVAKGFALHRFAYLRDPWNWLDFIVVCLGYVTLAPGVDNFSGIRTFRVLRALRTISALEGLKTMVNALLKSMRMLSDVLILTTFFIGVFALVGLQLFAGHLHNRCLPDHLRPTTHNGTANYSWEAYLTNSSLWPTTVKICGNNSGSMRCPTNYTCYPDAGPNPNSGFTSYDNFGWALLTSFQIVTLDFWEDVYLHVASSLGPWYAFYFIVVIFFGSFYLINLVLAVVAVSYQHETSHNANLESQYQRLREIASSYSLHRRIIPKLIYDDPTVENITSIPCVKNGPSVIILSRSNRIKAQVPAKQESLGRFFFTGRKSKTESATSKHQVRNRKMSSTSKRVRSGEFRKRDGSSTISEEEDAGVVEPDAEGKSAKEDMEGSMKNVSGSRDTASKKVPLQPDVSSNANTLQVPDAFSTSSSSSSHHGSPRKPTSTPMASPSAVKRRASLASRLSKRLVKDVAPTTFPVPYAELSPDELSLRQKFRLKIYWLVMNPWFELVVTIFISLNTICLSLEHHGMSKTLASCLDHANDVFTAIFVTEMSLKLIALAPRGYVKSKWNVFDGLVVVFSLVDTIIESTTNVKNAEFTILRSFRLFRVLKLAQSWYTMRMLLSAIARSLGALGNLTLILAIIVYMFAVVGVKVFSSKYDPKNFSDRQVPDWNFNNFGHSFMMIFRVLCGEWIEPLYDCMLTTGPQAVAFFLPALVVGNFLVLNLFLALLLNSFADQAIEEEIKQRKRMKSRLKWVSSTKKLAKIQGAFKTQKVVPTSSSRVAGRGASILARIAQEVVKEKRARESATTNGVTQGSKGLGEKAASSDQSMPSPISPPLPTIPSPVLSDASSPRNKADDEVNSTIQATKKTSVIPDATVHQPIKADPIRPSFLCCFHSSAKRITNSPWWRYRRERAQKVVEHKHFDNVILILILASSLLLVFEDVHLHQRPTLENALRILNFIFCVLFLLEFFIKVVACGVMGYLRNPWNILDFIIVLVSIVGVVNSFTTVSGNFQSLRSLRTLRALRPLRAVSRWEGMKIVVNSLLKAIPSIGNVLLVCLVFWLIFSILGVQFFGGKFYKCVGNDGERLLASLVPNKTSCLSQGYRWKNSNVNFDNALNGFLALLQVATFEGWIEVMKDAVDATQIDMQPRKENNFSAYFFFVVFIIIGAFFILNLFISVIIDNFYRLKKQYDDGGAIEVFLTQEQKQWFSTVKKALGRRPMKIIYRPSNRFKARLFDVVLSPKFETSTMILIMANIVCMMVKHYQQSDQVSEILSLINLVFTVFFAVETALRILVTEGQFFKDGWNMFDLVIVLLSVAGVILEQMRVILFFTPSVLRVARVLRIGRLLRYFSSAKGIRRLLVALVISLPALFNIGALLFLVLFIYAIIGMTNFGYVLKTGALNEVVNFETFGSSILVLFRLSTSAGWNDVLKALQVSPPDCDPKFNHIPNGNCGMPWVAVIFLVSFILITFLIIVNMYIAVILENFNQAHQQEEAGVTDEDIEMFYAIWQTYDPMATQYISYDKLSSFVANLRPPLSIPFPNTVAVHNLNLPMKNEDKIHCIDVLQALLRRVMGDINSSNTEHLNCMRSYIDRKMQQAFPIRDKDPTTTTTMERLAQNKAAVTIQRFYRSWLYGSGRRAGSVSQMLSPIDSSETDFPSRRRSLRLSLSSSQASVSSQCRLHTHVEPSSPCGGVLPNVASSDATLPRQVYDIYSLSPRKSNLGQEHCSVVSRVGIAKSQSAMERLGFGVRQGVLSEITSDHGSIAYEENWTTPTAQLTEKEFEIASARLSKSSRILEWHFTMDNSPRQWANKSVSVDQLHNFHSGLSVDASSRSSSRGTSAKSETIMSSTNLKRLASSNI